MSESEITVDAVNDEVIVSTCRWCSYEKKQPKYGIFFSTDDGCCERCGAMFNPFLTLTPSKKADYKLELWVNPDSSLYFEVNHGPDKPSVMYTFSLEQLQALGIVQLQDTKHDGKRINGPVIASIAKDDG